jgi:hypothetical protein
VNLAAIQAVLGISLLRTRTPGDRPGWHPLGPWLPYLLVGAVTVSTAAIGSKVLEVHLEFSLLPQISQQITPIRDLNKVPDGVRALQTHGIRGWATPEAIESSRLAMRTVDTIPSSQYGIGTYGMPGIYQGYVQRPDHEELAATLTMVGHSGGRADAQCARLCALQTNLVASPWVTVTLDGLRVPRRQLAIRPGALLTILAGRGAHHIEVQLGSWQTAALSWSILWLVVLFWGSGVAVLVSRTPRC